MITTVSAKAGSRRSRLRSVVLPAPRNPVRTVSGIGAGGPPRAVVMEPPRATAMPVSSRARLVGLGSGLRLGWGGDLRLLRLDGVRCLLLLLGLGAGGRFRGT